MDLSIIVCCYNSANRIEPTLYHIAKQVMYGLNCELLLVNNNCTDNTIEIAINAWNQLGSPFPINIINENEPGLSNARKAGVLSAKGEILVFCDDDNWLDENYLQIAYQLFRKDESIFGACGFCKPVSDIDLPDWFEEYSPLYACGLPQIKNGELITLRGAGMVLRAKIIKEIYKQGIKHFLIGRNGQELSSGEDDEISFWLKYIGGRLVYYNSLKLQHFMEEKRLTEVYRNKLVISIQESTLMLHRSFKIMEKANRKISKRDFLNIFICGDIGFISRLKLGFYRLNNPYLSNMKILNNFKKL